MAREEKKHYHHGDLRNQLIRTGLMVLSRDGVAGLSLRKVAKEAGVSHTAPYRHFANKDALLAAIALDGFIALTEGLEASYETHKGDIKEMILAAGVAYVRLAVSKPDTLRLMFGGMLKMKAVHEESERAAALQEDIPQPKEAYEALVRMIVHGQEAGVLVDAPERELALCFWSGVHGLAMLITADQLETPPASEAAVEQLTRQMCRHMLSGILK